MADSIQRDLDAAGKIRADAGRAVKTFYGRCGARAVLHAAGDGYVDYRDVLYGAGAGAAEDAERRRRHEKDDDAASGDFVAVQHHNGISCGSVSYHQRKAGKRGKVVSWTEASSRGNERFLLSVRSRRLCKDRVGFACTFTYGEQIPETPEIARKIREAFFMRLRRMGVQLWPLECGMAKTRRAAYSCVGVV